MKKSLLFTLFFLQILRGVTTAQNIYESIGEKAGMLTLSNGKYEEFIPNKTIVRIGTVLLNTKTHEIVDFVSPNDTSNTVEADVASRFLSVDPIGREYPELTPYQFAGNNPIKFIDLDGLEPALNPKSPENQDGRDPTSTIKSIYEKSGGEETFKKNFVLYMEGTYDANATVIGSENKESYTSDSKDASKYNLWVNNKGVFYPNDYPNWDSRTLVNFLMGTMVNGAGPENIVFPTNGAVSNLFKDAGIVTDALEAWYTINSRLEDKVGLRMEMDGLRGNLKSVVQNGVMHPETMIGSSTVTIKPINEKEILMTIFNVTSITSGDAAKHHRKKLGLGEYPISVVRDTTKGNSTSANRYGNISQTYSFTLMIDNERLKSK